MKKLILTLIVFGMCYAAFSQRKLTDDELNKSTVSKIKFEDTSSCGNIDSWVRSDIKNKTLFLFLQGGIAPAVFSNDNTFEREYDVYFYDFGDVAPDYKCVIKYNSTIFDYLTLKHGKKWMHQIRKDVIGFKEWKKKHG